MKKLHIENKETWEDLFCNQLSSGAYWRKLFVDDFDRHMFLERSDAVCICKKAKSYAYEEVISKLEGRISEAILSDVKTLLKNNLEKDDSALGMILNKIGCKNLCDCENFAECDSGVKWCSVCGKQLN